VLYYTTLKKLTGAKDTLHNNLINFKTENRLKSTTYEEKIAQVIS